MPAQRFIVTGRVQGVGFRAYVIRTALSIGVRGEVWNRRDGGVELVAEHSDSAVLLSLAGKLEHGPGQVEFVHGEVAEEQHYPGFDVGPSR